MPLFVLKHMYLRNKFALMIIFQIWLLETNVTGEKVK